MNARTVLIADDDSAIRTVLSQALKPGGFYGPVHRHSSFPLALGERR